jgi:hypothetical protein
LIPELHGAHAIAGAIAELHAALSVQVFDRIWLIGRERQKAVLDAIMVALISV